MLINGIDSQRGAGAGYGEQCALAPPPRTPIIAVSLITGFLGSGKTTLLNHLLAHPGMEETAVLINEFGEVGLDHLMVKELDDDIVLLKSGCICCTVQGELVDGMRELYLKRVAGTLPPIHSGRDRNHRASRTRFPSSPASCGTRCSSTPTAWIR